MVSVLLFFAGIAIVVVGAVKVFGKTKVEAEVKAVEEKVVSEVKKL